MARTTLLIVLLAATVLPLPVAAQSLPVLKSTSVTLPQSTGMFPPGPGADVANSDCLACHSVGMVMNQPALPKPAWEAEVNKMRTVYKAPVPDSDVATIVNYLTGIKGSK